MIVSLPYAGIASDTLSIVNLQKKCTYWDREFKDETTKKSFYKNLPVMFPGMRESHAVFSLHINLSPDFSRNHRRVSGRQLPVCRRRRRDFLRAAACWTHCSAFRTQSQEPRGQRRGPPNSRYFADAHTQTGQKVNGQSRVCSPLAPSQMLTGHSVRRAYSMSARGIQPIRKKQATSACTHTHTSVFRITLSPLLNYCCALQ